MENSSSSKQRRLPKFRRAPELYGRLRFSPTDLRILRLVHDYRYVTADHVLALIPGNARHLSERLQGLFHHAYLQRLLPPPSMRIADTPQKGSEKFTYVLDDAGAAMLARAEGKSTEDLAWKPRHVSRGHWFIEHHLMVATFRAAVELAAQRRPDVELVEWRDEADIRDGVIAKYADGRVEQFRVAPDGYFAIRQGNKVRHFFLEADRGSEEHARILPKFRGLWWYLAPKAPFFKKNPDAQDVLVLVVCESPTRLDAMRRTLAKVDKEGRGLRRFWFTVASNYTLSTPEGILSAPVWTVGPLTSAVATEGLRALFD